MQTSLLRLMMASLCSGADIGIVTQVPQYLRSDAGVATNLMRSMSYPVISAVQPSCLLCSDVEKNPGSKVSSPPSSSSSFSSTSLAVTLLPLLMLLLLLLLLLSPRSSSKTASISLCRAAM